MLSQPTEKINEFTVNIDTSSTADILKMINNEDKKAVSAVEKALPEVEKAVDVITENFKNGGRLFYFGAGTSGRLGVLDASECPPTFSVPETMVVGKIAGGDYALRHAVEGAEDSAENAFEDFSASKITENDTVVAISASGNARYVVEILRLAKNAGCKTVAVTSNDKSKMAEFSDIVIFTSTGAEVVSGSTRMKAGTAQKLVLNMLTTASMIKIGKVYKNYMIDVRPTNEKLKKRAVSIVAAVADCPEEHALEVLSSNGFNVKHAVLQIKEGISFEEASSLLEKNSGILRFALG